MKGDEKRGRRREKKYVTVYIFPSIYLLAKKKLRIRNQLREPIIYICSAGACLPITTQSVSRTACQNKNIAQNGRETKRRKERSKAQTTEQTNKYIGLMIEK